MKSVRPAWGQALLAREQRLRRNSLLALGALALMPGSGFGIDLCPLHILSGLICPLCGLCRSISSLLHGDLAASLRYHPLGVIVTVLLVYLTALNRYPFEHRVSEKWRVAAAGLVVTVIWIVRVWGPPGLRAVAW